ncbi:hypothetical protein ABIC30_002738 [Methylobacterium sp. 1030]|nr:hypothetical protein SAMN04488144_106105 [Methylobacterium sp. 190mf]
MRRPVAGFVAVSAAGATPCRATVQDVPLPWVAALRSR